MGLQFLFLSIQSFLKRLELSEYGGGEGGVKTTSGSESINSSSWVAQSAEISCDSSEGSINERALTFPFEVSLTGKSSLRLLRILVVLWYGTWQSLIHRTHNG